MIRHHVVSLLAWCALLAVAAGAQGADGVDGPSDVAGSGSAGLLIPPLDGEPAPAGARGAAILPQLRPPAAGPAYRIVPGPGEFRGAWLHWEDYRSPQAVSRTIEKARRAGLNVLLALANYPYQAMWQSRLIPVNPNVAAGFDPMVELVRQAHAGGIQIHPYIICLHGGLTKHPVFEDEWFVRDRNGNRVGNWLEPAHPGVRRLLVGLVTELAERGVDGVHFDYIRHEYDTDYSYSQFTRRLFQSEFGFDPLTLGKQPEGAAGVAVLQTTFHAGDGSGYFARLQRYVRQAGFHPPVVTEEQMRVLDPKNVVIAGNLYAGRISPRTTLVLRRFVAAGGAAVILDGPEATSADPDFAAAVGLSGKGFFGPSQVDITITDSAHPLTSGIGSSLQLQARGNPCPQVAPTAEVLARFADGTPAVVAQPHGQGWFVVINFHCYEPPASDDPRVIRLLHNAVSWLCDQQGVINSTTVVPGGVENPVGVWDRWRAEQVTELVRLMSEAARTTRPGIVVSAAAGTQRQDLLRVRRDGLSWLNRGLVDFLCSMNYTADNAQFQKRIDAELAPIQAHDPALRAQLYSGIGAYKLTSRPAQIVEQVTIARRNGLRGVCFFAFEHVTEPMVQALGSGPFRQPAPLPWRYEPRTD